MCKLERLAGVSGAEDAAGPFEQLSALRAFGITLQQLEHPTARVRR